MVMVIDKPHFSIKLHQILPEIDPKAGVKKELEDAVETNPILRGSLGFLFQNVIPLDVPLKYIELVELDERGRVKMVIPHRRDITIPLEPNECRELINKLSAYSDRETRRNRTHIGIGKAEAA